MLERDVTYSRILLRSTKERRLRSNTISAMQRWHCWRAASRSYCTYLMEHNDNTHASRVLDMHRTRTYCRSLEKIHSTASYSTPPSLLLVRGGMDEFLQASKQSKELVLNHVISSVTERTNELIGLVVVRLSCKRLYTYGR
jgi:hypothetical protein